MSYFDTKRALINQLTNASITGITNDDIAFENKNFDPSNKSLWLACYFLPATSEMLGKSTASANQDLGIFQVSVFVSLNNERYDDDQLIAIDSILSAFQYNSSTVYNNQKVDILESVSNAGSENESWFKRDVSINYLTFSTR
tara:strand:+ start:403 stop:828 length:426 start_codon:yes stop_codon:yes gene_type:complete